MSELKADVRLNAWWLAKDSTYAFGRDGHLRGRTKAFVGPDERHPW